MVLAQRTAALSDLQRLRDDIQNAKITLREVRLSAKQFILQAFCPTLD